MINSFLSIAVEINLLKVKELLASNILSLKCQNRDAQPAGFKRARELGGFFLFAMKAIVFAVSPLQWLKFSASISHAPNTSCTAYSVFPRVVWSFISSNPLIKPGFLSFFTTANVSVVFFLFCCFVCCCFFFFFSLKKYSYHSVPNSSARCDWWLSAPEANDSSSWSTVVLAMVTWSAETTGEFADLHAWRGFAGKGLPFDESP